MNSKKKGNAWENKLANWFSDHGLKAWKDPSSGGRNREKGDIGNNLDMTIESKAAKSIKLMEWWEQVDYAATLHKNQPVLFIHQDGMPDKQWLVVMHSEDWVELVKASRNVQDAPEPTMDYSQLSALTSLKAAIARVNKEFKL